MLFFLRYLYSQKLFFFLVAVIRIKMTKKCRSQYFGKPTAERPSVTTVQFRVPAKVRNTAANAFKLRDAGFGGGQETGWKRAEQLATQSHISAEDMRYIRNWFARHVITSYPSYFQWKIAGKPVKGHSAASWKSRHGIVAWEIWGGDAALSWVNANTPMLNKIFSMNYSIINTEY